MGFSHQETVRYSHRDTLKGLSIFFFDVALLLACGWAALAASSIWLQALASVGVGVVIAFLFIVGHDAAHQSLTPHRWLNELVGRLAMLPSLHTFSLWQLVHNQTHHRWTNLSPRDYVWTPLSPSEFASLSGTKQSVYKLYRSVAGPLVYYFFEFWIKRILFPSRKEVRGKYKNIYVADICLVCGFLLAYLAFLVRGGMLAQFHAEQRVANALLFGFLIPYAVWNVLMGFVIYLHHTHPGIRWFDNEQQWRQEASQSQSTVHVVFPGPINFFFHWIMEHNAHHERPSIPLYNLHAAQAQLAEKPEEEHVVMNWNPLSHYDVVRRCKLYDFVTHRWMDFAGNFTSPSLAQTSAAVPAPHFSKSPVQTDQTSSGR